MALKMHPSLFSPVGGWLKIEIIEAHGLSVTDAARLLKVTRQALSALLNGHAGLSPDMAIRFEKLFGISADTLIRMQANYDLRIAREQEGNIDIERLAVAA